MVVKRDFTDRFLKAVKPAPTGKRLILYDAAVPGFGLRITDKSNEADRGAFVLVARFPGSSNPTPRRIGDYPAMTLAEARGIAREWRTDIANGTDPKRRLAERLLEQKRRDADTFVALFEKFADDHLSTLRTGDAVAASVKKHVYPSWRDRPIVSLRRVDVNELVRDIRNVAPVMANRVLGYLKKFFGWVVDQDLREDNPAISVRRPSKETKRDRFLTEDEIRAVWTACGKIGVYGDAFRLMLVTAQRRSEVGGMQWVEIDCGKKNWTLPRERTKADRAHEVPLNDLAMSVIEQRPKLGKYVLATARSASRTKPEATEIAGWSKAKLRLDGIAELQLRRLKNDENATLPSWRLHDLRRTAATYMAQAGIDRIVISKILNHAEGGVTGVYDRFRYDAEKRSALDRWSLRLTQILEGSDTGIIHFKDARRSA